MSTAEVEAPPMHWDALPDMLLVKDVAAYCRVSTRTVHRWMDRGALTFTRFGSRIVVTKRSLAEALESWGAR